MNASAALSHSPRSKDPSAVAVIPFFAAPPKCLLTSPYRPCSGFRLIDVDPYRRRGGRGWRPAPGSAARAASRAKRLSNPTVHNVSSCASLEPATRILKIKSSFLIRSRSASSRAGAQFFGTVCDLHQHTLEFIQQTNDTRITGRQGRLPIQAGSYAPNPAAISRSSHEGRAFCDRIGVRDFHEKHLRTLQMIPDRDQQHAFANRRRRARNLRLAGARRIAARKERDSPARLPPPAPEPNAGAQATMTSGSGRASARVCSKPVLVLRGSMRNDLPNQPNSGRAEEPDTARGTRRSPPDAARRPTPFRRKSAESDRLLQGAAS